jgi:hypothetical protein
MRLLCLSPLRALVVSTLVCLALPVSDFGQNLTPEQSELLTAKAVSLRGDLASGNYRLAFQRAVELRLVLSDSPKAAEATTRVMKMASGPMAQSDMAPGSTSHLVASADRLLQAINAGDLGAAKEQIAALTTGIGDVYRAEVKRRAPDATPSADDPGAAHAHYVALERALEDSLVENSTAKSQALAAELQAIVGVMRSQHHYLGRYGFNLYEINDAFGRAALARGDYKTARDYLLKQTEVPAEEAEHMCCFGPNLWLAQSLIGAGYRGDVLTFLQGIGTFWNQDAGGKRDAWVQELKRGATPDMRPNNSVDFGYKP